MISRIMVIANLVVYFLLTQSPEIKWGRVYGGPGDDYGRCVLECIDKGYIAVGSTNSSGNGGFDVYIIKTDSLGFLEWSRTYGGVEDDYGYAICPAQNNCYLVVGATNSSGSGLSDIFVIKINENGDSVWARTYGDSMQEIGYSITETRDNNYLITGTTSSYGAGGIDVYTIKIDTLGELLWSKTYGGNLDDIGFCVDATDDGGFIFAGTTFSFGNGNGDVYVVKADSVGGTEWVGLFGTDQNETGLCVQQTIDSGYIICGSAHSVLLGYEWCLLRYNQNGSLIWNSFQGSLSDDFAYSVQEIDQKNYIVAGNFAYEMYVVRTDTAGYNRWSLIYGGAGTDCAYSIKQTADGGYIIAGITDSYGAGGYDVYLIKTYPDQLDIKEKFAQSAPQAPFDIQVSPNPFNKSLTIKFQIPSTKSQTNPNSQIIPSPFSSPHWGKGLGEGKSEIPGSVALYGRDSGGQAPTLQIYDVTGRLVKIFNYQTIQLSNHLTQIVWDGSDFSNNPLPRGVYYIVVETDRDYVIKKVIKI